METEDEEREEVEDEGREEAVGEAESCAATERGCDSARGGSATAGECSSRSGMALYALFIARRRGSGQQRPRPLHQHSNEQATAPTTVLLLSCCHCDRLSRDQMLMQRHESGQQRARRAAGGRGQGDLDLFRVQQIDLRNYGRSFSEYLRKAEFTSKLHLHNVQVVDCVSLLVVHPLAMLSRARHTPHLRTDAAVMCGCIQQQAADIPHDLLVLLASMTCDGDHHHTSDDTESHSCLSQGST